MSTLSTLYISQSYQGLLHLGTNQSITSSIGQGYVQIQDGVGVWMSASIDSDGNLYLVNDVSSSTITTNDIYVDNDLIVSGNLIVHDDVELRGNVDITGSVTISENLFVSGTIHAYEVITLIESSSVIFSSGSNVIGDSTSDTQTIVGQTTISGSLGVTGTQTNTGNLFVTNEISSSTINGIGNVALYSQSVDTRLDYLEGPFSTSVDSRLDYLEGAFSTSVDQRLDSIEFFTASQEAKDITLATYTGSVDNKFNAVGVYTASMNQYTQSNDTRISNIENYTASLRTAFTASGTDVNFNGNINVVGSINAYEIHTIIESSSVIFSSGSNVLGDNVSDTQTLNGTVTIPNTLFVAGVEFIPFSSSVDYRLDQIEAWSSSVSLDFVTQAELAAATGALEVSIAKKLDSASFESYTQSFDTKFNSYTQSVDDKFTTLASVTASLMAFTSSQEVKDSTLATYTGSVDTKFTTIGTYTGSNDTKWNTLGGYTASVDTKFNTIGSYTASNDTKWSTLGNLTGSYATTGSNNFIGTETISGSLIVSGSTTHIGTMINSGSVQGQVTTITATSLTASIDCSLGNFFNFNASSGDNFRLQATNIQPGETITLRISKTNTNATMTIDTGSIKFPYGFGYTMSTGNDKTDILTFVSFDTGSLYGVSAKNFV
jgi:hypothetical protein